MGSSGEQPADDKPTPPPATPAEEIKDIAKEIRETPPTTKEQAKEISDHLREIAKEIRDKGEGNDTSGSGDPYVDPYNHLTSPRRFGHDVSSQRFDDLDKSCIEFAIDCLKYKRKKNIAIDLGCGLGIQGLRLGLLGYVTHVYDIAPLPQVIREINLHYPLCKVRSLRTDLRDIKKNQFPQADIVYSQRFLHYLRYNDAKMLLHKIFEVMRNDGRLFLSVSGLHSEIGQNHPHREVSIEERYAKLPTELAAHHDIHEAMCPYSEGELVTLCRSVGFSCLSASCSEFGNVKGIFIK